MTTTRLPLLLALLGLMFVCAGQAGAVGSRGIVIEPGSRNPPTRLALVIGNDYEGESGRLQNPTHDADDMRKTLKQLGFEVMGDNQQSLEDMNALVREFGDRLRPGAVGLFYFAGHGMQINGQNYLIPVQSGIQREDEVPFRALAVDQVLAKMSKNKTGLNLMMLDACRDNPFARSFRSTTTGLAKMEAPSGMLISYAAKPGTRSMDGTGQNGLYTSVLLKYLPIPGLPIEQMLKKVGTEVRQRSGDAQQTWMEGLLDSGDGGDFCFAGCAGRAPTPTTPPFKPVEPGQKPLPATQPIPQRKPNVPPVKLTSKSSPQSVKACDVCPEMVRLPGGSFMMGSSENVAGRNKDERQHRVSVHSFSIGKHEVTQAEWRAVMGNNPSSFADCDRCPVEGVSWNYVQEYIGRLNASTGLHYRLPKEEEWEYACRAGKDTLYCGGNDINEVAWYKRNSGSKPHPVGQKQPNGFGIYDMSGNVEEWTCSGYGEKYDGEGICFSENNYKPVTRGGSFFYKEDIARSVRRGFNDSNAQTNDLGFRLASD